MMDDLFENCCPHCKRPYEQTPPAPDFAAFWAACPYKIGKASAEKAWRKLRPVDRADALARVVAFYAWFAKQYPTASTMHPATYLNGKRWNDEPVSGASAVTQDDTRAAIIKGMQSNIQSVRDHSERLAKRAGIQI